MRADSPTVKKTPTPQKKKRIGLVLGGGGGGGGKDGRCVGLTTLSPSSADCFEICESQPPGTLMVCLGL